MIKKKNEEQERILSVVQENPQLGKTEEQQLQTKFPNLLRVCPVSHILEICYSAMFINNCLKL